MPNDDVEKEFKEMQEAAEAASPGLDALLKVYGSYEQAVQQAQVYLGIVSPKPVFLTTDKSSL